MFSKMFNEAMDVSPFIYANGEALMNEVNNHTILTILLASLREIACG